MYAPIYNIYNNLLSISFSSGRNNKRDFKLETSHIFGLQINYINTYDEMNFLCVLNIVAMKKYIEQYVCLYT